MKKRVKISMRQRTVVFVGDDKVPFWLGSVVFTAIAGFGMLLQTKRPLPALDRTPPSARVIFYGGGLLKPGLVLAACSGYEARGIPLTTNRLRTGDSRWSRRRCLVMAVDSGARRRRK